MDSLADLIARKCLPPVYDQLAALDPSRPVSELLPQLGEDLFQARLADGRIVDAGFYNWGPDGVFRLVTVTGEHWDEAERILETRDPAELLECLRAVLQAAPDPPAAAAVLIGDPADFAVELAAPDAPAGFIRLCFHVRGRPVGDIGQQVVAGAAVGALDDLIVRLERQHAGPLAAGLGFDTLHDAAWGSGMPLRPTSPSNGTPRPGGLDPLDYYALPCGIEAFDGEAAYLCRDVDDADLFLGRTWDGAVIRAELPAGLYLQRLRTALDRLRAAGAAAVR